MTGLFNVTETLQGKQPKVLKETELLHAGPVVGFVNRRVWSGQYLWTEPPIPQGPLLSLQTPTKLPHKQCSHFRGLLEWDVVSLISYILVITSCVCDIMFMFCIVVLNSYSTFWDFIPNQPTGDVGVS